MNNINYLKAVERRQKVSDSIKTLAVELLDNKELVKLQELGKTIPYWFKESPDYAQLMTGISHYTKDLKDTPEIVEGDEKSVLVDMGGAIDPVSTLTEIDKKYDNVTVVFPIGTDKQINTYSRPDVESILTSKEGRRILNIKTEDQRIICEYDKKLPDNLRVRMYLGQGLEHWNPKTIAEVGCGGSETAMAMLCKELANKGCLPVLYAMDNQVWDGVFYRNHSEFKPDSMPCDLFISSRIPELMLSDIPASQKWLWLHDIHRWDKLTPEVAQKSNAIVVLSKWHANFTKRTYPFLKDSEIIDMDNMPLTYDDRYIDQTWYADSKLAKPPPLVIIGNALDASRFNVNVKRIPHRFIWCSSPDRGLLEVLNMWGGIKKELPDAELKIFYGWDYFNHATHIPSYREYKEKIRQLIKQPGVEWCGRIGQNQIALELAQADCMLYPPHDFRETYGIAFLEAQAAGCLCFYRQNGALGETVGDRGIPLSITATPEEIITKIVSTIKDEKGNGIIRDSARTFGLSRTWDKQADKILQVFGRLGNAENRRT